MKLRVAVVQFQSEDSLDKNLAKMERFLQKAKAKKAELVVFPEEFLNKRSEGRYFPHPKPKLKKIFQQLAKKYSMDIVGGSIVEKDWLGRRHNVSYYVDYRGKILCRYEKIHLWYPAEPEITAGKNPKVFTTRFGKFGLIICWDLAFPEIFRKMIKRDVEVVICPSNWRYGDAMRGLHYDKSSEIKYVDSLCTERAFEEELILVYCNSARRKTQKINESSIGHSQITEPFRGVIGKLNHNKEAMLVREIDTLVLKDAEKSYRIRKDLANK